MSKPSRVAPAILVTGCSSGIGLETAKLLFRRGYTVWAGVRRQDSLDSLSSLTARIEKEKGEKAARRWQPILLDVTKPESVSGAFATIEQTSSALKAVVNNAGYGQFGALEDLTEEEFRRQWEVNVAGTWRVVKGALPLLRSYGRGSTIVNVSSILGRVTLPFGGAYCASKHAVESLSDSLRVEVAPWGIRVAIVEPGPIATKFNENVLAAADIERIEHSVYEPAYERLLKYYRRQNRWGELPPDHCARVIAAAIESRNPQTRYLVTKSAVALAWAKRFAPDWLLDRVFSAYLRLPKE